MEQIIKLELTVQEVNSILASLGKHPFDQIAALISKIKQQGDAQVTEASAEPVPAQPAE